MKQLQEWGNVSLSLSLYLSPSVPLSVPLIFLTQFLIYHIQFFSISLSFSLTSSLCEFVVLSPPPLSTLFLRLSPVLPPVFFCPSFQIFFSEGQSRGTDQQ